MTPLYKGVNPIFFQFLSVAGLLEDYGCFTVLQLL